MREIKPYIVRLSSPGIKAMPMGNARITIGTVAPPVRLNIRLDFEIIFMSVSQIIRIFATEM